MDVKQAMDNIEKALLSLSGPTGEAFKVLFVSLETVKTAVEEAETARRIADKEF